MSRGFLGCLTPAEQNPIQYLSLVISDHSFTAKQSRQVQKCGLTSSYHAIQEKQCLDREKTQKEADKYESLGKYEALFMLMPLFCLIHLLVVGVCLL